MRVRPENVRRIVAAAVITAQLCTTIVATQVVAMLPASAASFSCSNAGKGGAAGTTTTSLDTYGATAGSSGRTVTVSDSAVSGVASGAECYVSYNAPNTNE